MKKLEAEIEQLRQEMVELALELGMSHPEVLVRSQRLDALLLKWHKLKLNGNKEKNANNVYRIKRNHDRLREKCLAVSFM